ncbi:hypothetical protein [Streptomyces sp. MMBL 11-1]|uniref:hypothetical protein n=1 Tax=Streptomyces sp. MMBL 11-1 TaxID=3026420 RepID=UPI002361BEAE|nr:hypothetical protein [Streptomyces sp. MMBL 11-1]
MTEKMQVLRWLHDQGEATLLQVVDGTNIPAGRAIAHLNALTRAQHTAKARRDRFDRYTITEAGREEVESWTAPLAPAPGKVRRAG